MEAVMPLLLVGHEWTSLVQVQIEDVVDIRDDHYFIFYVVLIQRCTVTSHHGRRNFLPLVKFPPVELLLQFIFSDCHINLIFGNRVLALGVEGHLAAAYAGRFFTLGSHVSAAFALTHFFAIFLIFSHVFILV